MPHSDKPTPEQEIARDCLAARLRLLNRLVSTVYDDALRPHGLRVSQMNILVVIAAAGPLRGVDVAQQLCLDGSTLSRDLERLLARKWVRATPGKGRAKLLEATVSGRRLIARVLDDWRAAQRTARELLSPAAAAALAAVVDARWAESDQAG